MIRNFCIKIFRRLLLESMHGWTMYRKHCPARGPQTSHNTQYFILLTTFNCYSARLNVYYSMYIDLRIARLEIRFHFILNTCCQLNNIHHVIRTRNINLPFNISWHNQWWFALFELTHKVTLYVFINISTQCPLS